MSRAQNAKAGVVASVLAVQCVALSASCALREKGLRTCLADTARAAQQAFSSKLEDAQSRAGETFDLLCSKADDTLSDAMVVSDICLSNAFNRAIKASTATSDLVSQRSFQATAASAVVGALAMGTGGGATGLALGSMIGAVAGLPFAIVTFGMSVPIAAATGGGTGLVAGVAVGATTGAVGGGAAGYGIYKNRDNIAGVTKFVATTASGGAERLQGAARYVREVASRRVPIVQVASSRVPIANEAAPPRVRPSKVPRIID